MAKILQTNLPIAQEQQVSSDTFNRAIRVLELNLNAVDVDNTPQYNPVSYTHLTLPTKA